MIRSSEQLEDFNRRYAAADLSRLSYRDALAIFEGLWRYASQINKEFPGNWKTDVEADIELARVLNGVAQRP